MAFHGCRSDSGSSLHAGWVGVFTLSLLITDINCSDQPMEHSVIFSKVSWVEPILSNEVKFVALGYNSVPIVKFKQGPLIL